MKVLISLVLSISTLFSSLSATNSINDTNIVAETAAQENETQPDLGIECRGAVLMEAKTGTVLYDLDGNYEGSPASVTKVMTLLLVMEAIDCGKINLDDKVVISAYASSMGGSQVFLEEGEEFTVRDLIKCTVISSANDSAVALAELVGGSETGFVSLMNKKAQELGLSGSNFENVTGLDDDTTDHKSSPLDIAIMSRELIKHPLILEYSSIWQDSIRDGAFTLTNTNRLVRFYKGCNGLKTGSTSKAGYCVTVTAEREGMTLIAVVMGADTRDKRNEIARTLLDFGFANYEVYSSPELNTKMVKVLKGTEDYCELTREDLSIVVKKGTAKHITATETINETVKAPQNKDDVIGKITYSLDGKILAEQEIKVKEDIEATSFSKNLTKMLASVIAGKK